MKKSTKKKAQRAKKKAKKPAETKVVYVTLGRIVRDQGTVAIRMPVGMDPDRLASATYRDVEPNWEADDDWGADESEHYVEDAPQGTEPDCVASEENGVITVERI